MSLFTDQQIKDTVHVLESALANCEKVQAKLKEGTASLSLNKNRIKALGISRTLLLEEEPHCTKEELEKAIVQITSIKNKSRTGKSHAKEGSAAHTRFSRLIAAMDVALDCLQRAAER